MADRNEFQDVELTNDDGYVMAGYQTRSGYWDKVA